MWNAAEDWQHGAACRGQDAIYFFAPNYFERREEKNAREAVAKSFCVRCPVRDRAWSTPWPRGRPTASGAA